MIYALYHYKPETLGLIKTVLDQLNLNVQEIRLYKGEHLPPDLEAEDGLIVMGGPMGVADFEQYSFLKPELKLIQNSIRAGRPVLGICLGAQLIATALGADVYPNAVREVGWHPLQLTPSGQEDPVFKHIQNNLSVLHWHGDTFTLPDGAAHLAATPHCQQQAFRYGKHVYALQFHLEVNAAMVQQWCQDPLGPDYIRGAGEDPADIVRQAKDVLQTLQPQAERFFQEYFKAAYLKPALS